MENFLDTIKNLQWGLITALGSTGIIIALLSAFVGLKQKVEVPLWWGLYAIWITVVLVTDSNAPFLTIITSSILAGLLSGMTNALLIDRYKKNNPWYAKQLRGSNRKIATRFVIMGVVVGICFGAIVGGIACGLSLI